METHLHLHGVSNVKFEDMASEGLYITGPHLERINKHTAFSMKGIFLVQLTLGLKFLKHIQQ